MYIVYLGEECGKFILHLRCVLLLVLEQHICISIFILLLLQAPNTWFDNPPDFPVDVAEIKNNHVIHKINFI